MSLESALSIFLILAPFCTAPILATNLTSLPGTKPLLLFGLFLILIALVNHRQSVKMPRLAFFFTIILITLFTVSILRSLTYLPQIAWLEDVPDNSTIAYLLSYFIKPLVYFLPFIIIAKFFYQQRQFRIVVGSIGVALALLSSFLLYVFIQNIGQSVNEISDIYADLLGTHRNNLATFFIVGFPFLIARFLVKKNASSIMCLGLAIVGTGVLFSRAAYFTVLFTIVLYPIVSKRIKFLPVLIVCGLILVALTPSIIRDRALKGLEEKDANEITAGRALDIWGPLVNESMDNYEKLVLGNGRRAIVYSDAANTGKILKVTHPHDMYLELVLDSGLVGLAGVMPFYIILLRQTYRSLKSIDDNELREYQYAVIVALIGFLISGLTDRSLFPNDENCYLWAVMGFGFSTVRWSQAASYRKALKTHRSWVKTQCLSA
jgi:O-antigen ligase